MLMGLKDKRQVEKNHNFWQSLHHALTGIYQVFIEERNMRFHFGTSILVLGLGFLFKLHRFEWLWLLLAIFLVMLSELVNTVVENLVDLLTQHHYELAAKNAKDMAATAVLLAACFAIIIGIIIFMPHLWPLIN
ncbi:diacylglycerol kinase family protein [Loigolactobacillus backii]|uniref:UDP kinase n=1 Tax=Loigolactobacillus backii TaxID=375175 RepID=A0A192H3N0_9LACO|nr:diacylglycerol kinase family protein [Loigolactobacillus backii]ANK59596.1 UDP kinase [Loigolactobacillus backii]ANK62837.1 UDP kinase [Loigolactobacillus backii]ANK64590.1 UDP kinase [Loigolactobacillus backii]ANK67014.1 UDP kinase [Loigolactobacillus backii]ANK70155.1 UDP kinase [Loigolactobacillus backii]